MAENAGNMAEIAVSADFLWTFSTYFVCIVFSHKTISDIAFSFVRLFVRSFVHSHARSCFHYQVGPISMWLVFYCF